jgi:hypothetical protein
MIYRIRVKSQNKKYFSFTERQISLHLCPSVLLRRASAVVTAVGRVAVDATVAIDERSSSVRQKRVVLTPVVWRQVLKKLTLPRGDGGNRASTHRGERAISRKAIAQGMSDVLRCPVCSCALCFVLPHMRSRVQRASGIPCALWIGGWEVQEQTSGARRRENAKLHQPSLRGALATKQSTSPLCRTMDCFAEPVIGRAFARPGGSQ